MHEERNATEPRGLGEREREVLSVLASLERPTVSADDVQKHFDISRKGANVILSRLARKRWLRRLRRGSYAVVPLSSRTGKMVVEDPLATAMDLFAPCYISGWTAAEHWGLTEQVSNTVVVYSAKPQRRADQGIGGVSYRVRRVPEDAIFATTRVWSGTTAVEMATVHRTVIDVLDAPEMGGGGRQALDIVRAYWQHPEADPEALMELALRLGRGSVFKRLGFTTERFADPDEGWLTRSRDQLSAGIALLDPSGPDRGQIVTRWRLRINVPLEEEP